MSQVDEEVYECPYCGKTFDDKVEEGVHRAEEHVGQDDSIPRVAEGSMSKDNLVDEWESDED